MATLDVSRVTRRVTIILGESFGENIVPSNPREVSGVHPSGNFPDNIFQFTEMFGTQISFECCDNSHNKRPNQCWRCQGFFHSSEVCRLPIKCLKCAGPHEDKNCNRAFEDPLICANCGGEHAANWHQCSRFPKTKNNKKAPQKGNKNKNQHPKGNNPNSLPKNKIHERNFGSRNDLNLKSSRMHAQSKIQQPHTNNHAVIPSVSYSKVVSGQIREISLVNTPNSNFSTIFTNVIQIANDEGVVEELLTRAFREAIPALRKLSHPDDKACNNLIIAGDLNAAYKTWNNSRSNNFGFRLKRIIQNFPIARIVAPYTPTHINSRSRPGARDSIIDLAVFKNIPFNYDIRVIDDLCSDHLPIILTLCTNSATMKIPEQLSTNWENFRFLLKNKPLPIPESPSNKHLYVAIGRLGENTSEALVADSKPKFKTAPIKLPPDIRSKIRHRNRVRRFWQRSREPALKNELRTISNEIASDIRHLSRARWEKTIEELSPETDTLWRRSSLFKKPFHHIPLKGALGSIAVAAIEKAKVIADSLQKQFEPNTDVESPRLSAHKQRKVQRLLDSPTCMDLEKTSPSELQEFIKNLKPNKSPGIELIKNRILKNILTKFIIFIVLLLKMLFVKNCYFLKSWRMVVVIPILKPNSDYSNPQNYRPISLLSSLSKAYEFVILNRLNQHCLARNIIIPEQHGFVTKRSTVTQLLRVTELVHTDFQNHQTTGMLFVDIAKAFDRIWHDVLVSKMMRLGFSNQILKFIRSYLKSREFRIRVENCLSNPRPVKSGIPQGNLLGPRLFNLYINDIPKADNVHLAMYTDDTAIISQHTCNLKIIERLQNYITRLQLWLVAWKIKVNESKSVRLLFTKQRCIGNLPNINIFDQPVPWVTEFKYLGFILDAKLLNSPTHTHPSYTSKIGRNEPNAQLLNFSKE
ncbi:probable RNA-directed DNA polymerase from transposon X-element [Trichonephila clavipes]|nr:probable RNA-directed DNA polymerase from transposon X-element [Trichonephila clavipes]